MSTLRKRLDKLAATIEPAKSGEPTRADLSTLTDDELRFLCDNFDRRCNNQLTTEERAQYDAIMTEIDAATFGRSTRPKWTFMPLEQRLRQRQ